jgi:6-phospho-beta-glucosidase
VVQKVEKQLFELYKNPDLNVKPKELEQRGGAYYSDAACEVINAIYNDKQTEHYVNIPHHGHIDNIPADWAVEMTCTWVATARSRRRASPISMRRCWG